MMLRLIFIKFIIKLELFALKNIGKEDEEYEKYKAIVDEHKKQYAQEVMKKAIKDFWK